MQHKLRETSLILQALRNLTGLSFVWKISNLMMVEDTLPEEQRFHIHPFCQRVKCNQEKHRLCLLNDYNLLSARVRKQPEPFVHRCHAGANELVIPVMHHNHCLGVVQCGPWRYPDDEDDALLPVCTEEMINSLILLIPRLLQQVALQAYPLLPRDLNITMRDERIQEAVEHIERNFSRCITVRSLAASCHLSTSRLIHLFKQECGMGISEYVQQVRVREARKLLSFTDMGLGEIADCCGFSNQSHFSSVFRRLTNVSPLHFRKYNFQPPEST